MNQTPPTPPQNGSAPRRAVQYLRAFSKDTPVSVNRQRVALQELAILRNLEVVRTFEDTAGSHKDLEALLEWVTTFDAKAGLLLTYSVDCLSKHRDPDDAAYWEYRFAKEGIPILYCSEPPKVETPTIQGICRLLRNALKGELTREVRAEVIRRASDPSRGDPLLAALDQVLGWQPPSDIRAAYEEACILIPRKNSEEESS